MPCEALTLGIRIAIGAVVVKAGFANCDYLRVGSEGCERLRGRLLLEFQNRVRMDTDAC